MIHDVQSVEIWVKICRRYTIKDQAAQIIPKEATHIQEGGTTIDALQDCGIGWRPGDCGNEPMSQAYTWIGSGHP